MAAEPTPGTLDPILRKPTVTLGLVAAAGVATVALIALAFWLFGEQIKPVLANQFTFSIIVMIVMYGLIMSSTAICILAERKISAYIQDRMGPNRVGWLGLLQPMADGLKFFLKEDIIPKNVDKPLFLLAPAIALVISLLGFIIIPWTGPFHWPWAPAGEQVVGQVIKVDIGVLFLMAVASIGVYGAVLAGYASNNKYSFLGGMRAAAQMISYEAPLGLGLLCILLVAGTLQLNEIVEMQAKSGVWFVFLHPLAFLIILVATFAETNRLPFDLAESEQELVGGFHTEYSSMKFAMFFLGEYVHMITGSALMVALFFGGYALPWPLNGWLMSGTPLAAFGQWLVYLAKVAVFIWFFMVIRWTIPRFRYDQLMRLAWKGLIPLGVVLVAVTAVLSHFQLENTIWSLVANGLVVVGMLAAAALSKQPVTGRQANLPPVNVKPSRRPSV